MSKDKLTGSYKTICDEDTILLIIVVCLDMYVSGRE